MLILLCVPNPDLVTCTYVCVYNTDAIVYGCMVWVCT